MEAYERGLAIVRENNDGLSLDQVLPYLKVLYTQAEENPDDARENSLKLFDAAQIVRDSVTAQTISQMAAQLASGDAEVAVLARELFELRRDINDLNLSIDRALARPDAQARLDEIDAMQDRRDDLREERARIDQTLQSAAPRFNQLMMEPVATERVMDALGPDEAMIQILLGEQESVSILITRDGITPVFRSLGADEVGDAVLRLRQGLVIDREQRLGSFDTDLAHAVYNAFIEPFEAQLADKRHLIMVPSGPLLSLPLGVLVREPAVVRREDYRDVAWLARDFAISIVPSPRNLVDLRSTVRPSVAPEPFIGYGDFQPVFDREPVDGDSCAARLYRAVRNAQRLPETGQELLDVARALGASARSVRLGRSFTEAAVRREALDRYRIVYFATHGFMPAGDNCLNEPALLATPGLSEAGEADNGLLRLSDVVSLNLDADMVVLSACNTGGGDGTGGEALSGLARGFFYSGARSLLVSHWYVESAASRDLMTTLFYLQRSNTTLGSAEAMRRARQSLMVSEDGPYTAYRSHPTFWAGFTIIGDGARPVSVR